VPGEGRAGRRQGGNSLEELRRNLPVLLLHNLNPEWTPEERQESEQDVATLARAVNELGHPLEVTALEDDRLADLLCAFDPREHIVFNWCEELPGVPHSEPQVAAVLERQGFVFTGSPSDALALCQDKPRVKRLLDEAHIPTPRWQVFHEPGVGGWDLFPAIVKAAHEHCSIGIAAESIVVSAAELEARVDYILEAHRQPALVEEFINGREFHQAAWGNGRVSVLPAAEMDYGDLTDIRDRLFTYEAKYVPGSRLYQKIELCVPAELDPAALAELERTVLAAYRASGCRDYGRVDARYLDGVFYVIDVNPNPDINPLTSMIYAAAEMGYSYGETGSRIVNLAAARHPVFRQS
jgi:D-alanine-D-alanine ligase